MKRASLVFLLSAIILFLGFVSLYLPDAKAQGLPISNITAEPLPGQAGNQQPLLSSTDACQKLPPTQRAVCQEEMKKTGGAITPELLNALKERPEFRTAAGAEGTAVGREIPERRERTGERGLSERSLQPDIQRRLSGEEPGDKSLFDRTRRIGKYQDISLNLKPFGYDFFIDASVRLLTERKDIPVPLKYIIGPGDEVKLLLWGRLNAQYNLTVDRDGKITIPQIGPLFVAGMTFEEMSKQIIKQSEQVVGTNVDISMGSLKTIPVFILGDVRRPGSYTIGSFATITDALLLAGGPTDIGSMRNVQLKRKGQLITTFDLYDLLLKGDKSKDVILMAGDVVFVPVTGPLVGVAGNVRRPAIYELRGRYDLEHLFDLAGGIIPSADTQQIQVERIVRNERQVVLDINDKKLEKATMIHLQDADLVKVFSIVDTNVNAVYLSGNVKRPGKYEMKPGMRISDLIGGPDDLLKETYFDYALIKRLKLPGRETELIPFNLGNVVFKKDKASDIELKREDRITVFSRWFFRDKPTVAIEGEIRGDCSVEQGAVPESNRMERAAPMAGRKPAQDLTVNAPQKIMDLGAVPEERNGSDMGAVFKEMKNIEDDLKKQGQYNLAGTIRDISDSLKNYNRAPSETMRVARDDLIRIGRMDLADRLRDIENKLKPICTMGLHVNMRVKDAILAAGGLTNDSYLDKGEIIRTNKKREYTTLYFDVAKAMENDSANNLELHDQDRIVIHSVWEQVYKKQVSVDGDVARPGDYQYTDGMTVRDLIFKGGNILESAYVDEAEISSIVIEKGRKTSKTDRRVINLRKALEGDPADNITLRPYDRLLVKRIPNWASMKYVTVTGEFRFPGRYAIHKGEKLSSLIERAGGFNPGAYMRGAVFTRQRVKELQQQSLDEMASRMERELLVQGSVAASKAASADEMKAREIETAQKQKFVATLKSLKAQGRMTIYLANARLLKGSEYDIDLEDGDTLFLPQKNNVVNVMGAVMAQASYIYLDQLTYKDYIRVAGGYSRYADESSTFVLKADGSARKLGRGFLNWSDSRDRWEVTAFGEQIREIEPGDVIIVPEQFEQVAWLREIRDITQILMNTAVVTATLIKVLL